MPTTNRGQAVSSTVALCSGEAKKLVALQFQKWVSQKCPSLVLKIWKLPEALPVFMPLYGNSEKLESDISERWQQQGKSTHPSSSQHLAPDPWAWHTLEEGLLLSEFFLKVPSQTTPHPVRATGPVIIVVLQFYLNKSSCTQLKY